MMQVISANSLLKLHMRVAAFGIVLACLRRAMLHAVAISQAGFSFALTPTTEKERPVLPETAGQPGIREAMNRKFRAGSRHSGSGEKGYKKA